MKIRLQLVKSSIQSKLKLVKAVKVVTGLGLKEAKGIVDNLRKIGDVVEFEINENFTSFNGDKAHQVEAYKYLVKEISECGDEVTINGGIQWKRDIKMLLIGIGEREDYVNFIKDYASLGDNRFYDKIIMKLSKNSLRELVKEINDEMSNI